MSVVSIQSEFVDNMDGAEEKQDCKKSMLAADGKAGMIM